MSDQSEERLIKGPIVLDIVKAIRSVKDKPWDKYLSDEARAMVSQQIFPTGWYSYELFLECLHAVYEVLGNNDPEVPRQWGKVFGKGLLESIYKNAVIPGDPAESLLKLDVIAVRAFRKGMMTKPEKVSDKHYRNTVFDDDPRGEPVYYILQGWIEALIEMAGGKNPRVEFVEKHWEGTEATVFDIQWE
jgi:hypothetical protein